MRGSTAEGVLRSPPRDAGAGRLAKRDASRESLLNTTGSADSGSLAGAGSEEEREFECSSVSSQDSMLDFGPFRGLEGPKRLWVAAVFWLLGGWAGLHRLYLGDAAGAKAMLLSCGRFAVGWLADGFRLSEMVRAANGAKEDGADRQSRTVVSVGGCQGERERERERVCVCVCSTSVR